MKRRGYAVAILIIAAMQTNASLTEPMTGSICAPSVQLSHAPDLSNPWEAIATLESILSNEQQTEISDLSFTYQTAIAEVSAEIQYLSDEIATANPMKPGYMEYTAAISAEKADFQRSLESLNAEHLMKVFYVLTPAQREQLDNRSTSRFSNDIPNAENSLVLTTCQSPDV